MTNEPAGQGPVDQTVGPCAWRVRRHDAPKYWIMFMHKPVDAMADAEREVQPLVTFAQAEQMVVEERGRCSQAVKLADDRLKQMYADRDQALRWKVALDKALTVCRCAARVVDSSAYQGVSDEDCDLENAVRNWRTAFNSTAATSEPVVT